MKRPSSLTPMQAALLENRRDVERLIAKHKFPKEPVGSVRIPSLFTKLLVMFSTSKERVPKLFLLRVARALNDVDRPKSPPTRPRVRWQLPDGLDALDTRRILPQLQRARAANRISEEELIVTTAILSSLENDSLHSPDALDSCHPDLSLEKVSSVLLRCFKSLGEISDSTD